MTKTVVSVTAAVAAAMILVGAGSSAREAVPPAGLTPFGRVIWNVDALLHDTFGSRRVYVDYTGNGPAPATFSTKFISEAQSSYYVYTFAKARGSAYRIVSPSRAVRPSLGVSGGEVPLRVGKDYITCGGDRWLYERIGNGPANWVLSCLNA